MDEIIDLENFIDDEEELDALHENDHGRLPRQIRDHFDPFATTDYYFFQCYRFTKESVYRLSRLVFPEPAVTDRPATKTWRSIKISFAWYLYI